jgi:transposase
MAWTPEVAQSSRDPKCCLLRLEEWLPVAHAPSRFPYGRKTVLHYFRTWRLDGTFERLNRTMRRLLREKLGRDPESSAGIVDAHSAKTTGE